ncbi:MAG: hypothetical protein KDB86_05345 [Actinobacteria bacterium]|nr:hypothetical protein [Actinomycetota bacterium]MCB9390090.1 hypothetical protein [Acidimicrobiia bacterium]
MSRREIGGVAAVVIVLILGMVIDGRDGLMKVGIALAAALVLYLIGANTVAGFAGIPPTNNPDEEDLEMVDYGFRCGVCGAIVHMTLAPTGEVPNAPRHCREPMDPLVTSGDGSDDDPWWMRESE